MANYSTQHNDRRGGDGERQPKRKGRKPAANRTRTEKIVRRIWGGTGIFVGVVFVLFALMYNGIIGYMPPVEELKNPKDNFASIVYTADGVEMGRYFRNTGNRVYADFDEISPYVVNALIATEDVRFEDHSGIDFRALSRAIVKRGILRQKNAGGGSTITQQLAKQLYTPPTDNTLDRALQKPIEWMIAIKLERFYSKEEIIKMYLNQFDFLYNAVGIKSAAKVYFNKDARDLNLQEAATLVGMVKNPAYFNPVRHLDRTRDRRNVVFEQMYKAGMINAAELDSLQALPLTLDFHRVDHKDGMAPYFREELRRYLNAKRPHRQDYPSWDRDRFITDSIEWENNPLYGWIQKNPKPDGTLYDLYNDGLRIYTTIDSRMQRYAQEAVDEHMRQLQREFFAEKRGSKAAPYTSNPEELSASARARLIKNAMRQSERWRVGKAAGKSDAEIEQEFNKTFDMTMFTYDGAKEMSMTPRDSILYVKSYLRTGFMAMDPTNGYIKAYVGGPDFKFFQYDMVSLGRRQVGSTIKPFLYTYAMEQGKTPCSTYLNAQPVIYDAGGKPWMPRNSGNSRVGEMVDLRWALTNSNNWISARLIDEFGPRALVDRMHAFGITSPLPAVKSLALGPCEVSLKEMVTAYTAFANGGMRSDPMMVTAIADNNGNVIARFTPRHSEVISREAYYRILSILLNVVDGGTGNRLRRGPFNLTAQIGGKTGTTNDNSDGWFMGFTPDIVGGAWVGGEERYIHFNNMAQGQGAAMALPIFGKFMRKLYNDRSLPYNESTRFNFPADVSLCGGEWSGHAEDESAEQSVEGAFD